ncbi:MAG: hypothetical protein WD535_04290 [Thermaerobacterales bacterium]
MKMEFVQQRLQEWGEVMITTDGGQTFELHLGDTEFDLKERVIRLQTPTGIFFIPGDGVEVIQQHYGHPVE